MDRLHSHRLLFGVLQLIRQIDTDREYVEQHTKWQKKATEALTTTSAVAASPADGSLQNKNKPSAGLAATAEVSKFKSELLLRGSELILAQAWLADAEQNKKSPKVTDIQKALIQASEKAQKEQEEQERQTAKNLRTRLRIAQIAAAVATVLVFVAGWFWYDAQQQKEEAQKQRDNANKALKGFYETQIFDAENIRNILQVDKNEKGVKRETTKIDSIKNLIKALE